MNNFEIKNLIVTPTREKGLFTENYPSNNKQQMIHLKFTNTLKKSI